MDGLGCLSVLHAGEEKPMIQRFALHAFALEIPDLNGNLIHINAKYPKDFRVFLSQLQKFDKLFV